MQALLTFIHSSGVIEIESMIVGHEDSGVSESRLEVFSLVKTEQINNDALSESLVIVLPES